MYHISPIHGWTKGSLFSNFQMLMVLVFMWTCDRSKMDLSVSAGDLLQMDGTLDKGVLTGEDLIPASRPKRYEYPFLKAGDYTYQISLHSLPPINASKVTCLAQY